MNASSSFVMTGSGLAGASCADTAPLKMRHRQANARGKVKRRSKSTRPPGEGLAGVILDERPAWRVRRNCGEYTSPASINSTVSAAALLGLTSQRREKLHGALSSPRCFDGRGPLSGRFRSAHAEGRRGSGRDGDPCPRRDDFARHAPFIQKGKRYAFTWPGGGPPQTYIVKDTRPDGWVLVEVAEENVDPAYVPHGTIAMRWLNVGIATSIQEMRPLLY